MVIWQGFEPLTLWFLVLWLTHSLEKSTSTHVPHNSSQTYQMLQVSVAILIWSILSINSNCIHLNFPVNSLCKVRQFKPHKLTSRNPLKNILNNEISLYYSFLFKQIITICTKNYLQMNSSHELQSFISFICSLIIHQTKMARVLLVKTNDTISLFSNDLLLLFTLSIVASVCKQSIEGGIITRLRSDARLAPSRVQH